MIQFCRQYFSSKALKEVFRFTYIRTQKYGGNWQQEIHLMFPGYVFLESQDDGLLFEELMNHQQKAFFFWFREELLRITPEEERNLMQLCGQNHHMGMSRGLIRDGITYVTEGPLKGKEQFIRKIDRHKRLAMLSMSLHSHVSDVWTGLEIVSKS